jgi:acetoin utilization protein AcuB
MFVGQRMSHPVITAYPDTTMEDALELMHNQQVRRLPVIDRQGKLSGIVSERVLLKASPSDATTLDRWEMKEKMRQMTIENFMTRDVTTVTEDTPLEEAACIMEDQNITGLPVVKGDNLVGFITMLDIFKVFLEFMGAREPGVRVAALMSVKPGTLYHLTKALYEAGGDVRRMGIFYGESTGNGEVLFKVDGIEKGKIRATITPLVEKVLDVR